MNLQQLFSKVDTQTLQKGIDAVKEALETKDGQELANQLRGLDMNQLSKKLSQPNNQQLEKFVSNLDLSSIEQKLGNMNKEDVVKAISRNKDFTGQLTKILNQ